MYTGLKFSYFPKGVIKRINQICTNFLWQGEEHYTKPGHVRWEKVCSPKKQGGLGIKNLYLWNMLAVGKFVWSIAVKQDTLWVKWVHSIYIKNKSWLDYKPPQNASWVWRHICQVKEQMKAINDNLSQPGNGRHYSI